MSRSLLSGKKIAIALIVASALLAAVFRLYAIQEGVGGLAIWNRAEAYVFIQVGRRGYSSSYLWFPWILFKERVIGGFAGAVEPDDGRAFLVVIHVTPAGVERHVVGLEDPVNGEPGTDPTRYTPLDGRIYAAWAKLYGLCWWSGDHFEKAPEEERQRFDGISRLTTGDFENDADGWSRRGFGAPSYGTLEIGVGDQFKVLVNTVKLEGTDLGTVSINLQRPGRAPDRIAEFEAREGSVSRAEYRHAFRDPE
jgi:hypothetical protein